MRKPAKYIALAGMAALLAVSVVGCGGSSNPTVPTVSSDPNAKPTGGNDAPQGDRLAPSAAGVGSLPPGSAPPGTGPGGPSGGR